jgi:hypothetical protein
MKKLFYTSEIENQQQVLEPNLEILAKLKITDQNGKKLDTPKIEEMYRTSDTSIDYSPNSISYENRTYIFQYPLRCKIEKEEDFLIIESELLDIVASGKSIEEAITDFAEEFDYCYQRYNEIKDENLSDRIKNIKYFLNHYIKEIN